MVPLKRITTKLENYAPLNLSAEWDNTGLLIGSLDSQVTKVLTCLTCQEDVVKEALDKGVQLILSHHPFPFRSLKKVTDQNSPGKLLMSLLKNEIALYSPHTAFDSAELGINQIWANKLNLKNTTHIKPPSPNQSFGSGRIGAFESPLDTKDLVSKIQSICDCKLLKVAGEKRATITKLAVACGSGGDFIYDAHNKGADAFLTGEANLHSLIEAKSYGMTVLLVGHFASERFAIDMLGKFLNKEFDSIEVIPSQWEKDPIFNCNQY